MNSDHVKVAIAPIGWTNDDMPDLGKENTFQQCISEMALAGYVGSEVGSKYPRDLEVLKSALKLRGIQICNAWFSTFFAEGRQEETLSDFDETLNFLHSLGAKVIGCSEQSFSIQCKPTPMYQGKPVFNDKEWQRVVDGYNVIAERAEKKGMSVCLHHHLCTGIETVAEIDRFIASVNENIFLLFDTGHLYAATHNQEVVVALLEKYFPRIRHIHLKDCRDAILQQVKDQKLSFLDGVRKGMFTVPGDGVIDFAPIFELLSKHDYKGWLVVEAEQDPAVANPFEYALKARQFIHEMAGL